MKDHRVDYCNRKANRDTDDLAKTRHVCNLQLLISFFNIIFFSVSKKQKVAATFVLLVDVIVVWESTISKELVQLQKKFRKNLGNLAS